ncbi:MAG: hypothetical protein U5N86_01920 [Planctomycetota bacterium]|nr:hypothetical protein [Planctomycetota bacterium]
MKHGKSRSRARMPFAFAKLAKLALVLGAVVTFWGCSSRPAPTNCMEWVKVEAALQKEYKEASWRDVLSKEGIALPLIAVLKTDNGLHAILLIRDGAGYYEYKDNGYLTGLAGSKGIIAKDELQDKLAWFLVEKSPAEQPSSTHSQPVANVR